MVPKHRVGLIFVDISLLLGEEKPHVFTQSFKAAPGRFADVDGPAAGGGFLTFLADQLITDTLFSTRNALARCRFASNA